MLVLNSVWNSVSWRWQPEFHSRMEVSKTKPFWWPKLVMLVTSE